MGIIYLIAVLVIVYCIIAIIVNLVRKNEIKQNEHTDLPKLPLSVAAIIIGLVVILVASTIIRIGAQDVGVVVSPSGVNDEELHSGWHIIMPWNKVHKMDKTVWVYTCAHAPKEGEKEVTDAIWAPTKDGIKMGFDVSVSWHIIPDEASWIYQNVSENDGGNSGRYLWLEQNVIRAKIKSALALTVSNYTPIEVYSTKREEMQGLIMDRMIKEVAPYKLTIDQVDLREVFYNHEYEQAINGKKLAEQEVLRLVEVTRQKEEQLKQAEINKNIAIQQAEGEAKALQIKGSSLMQNPRIIELEWINKWDGALPNYMMGDGQGVILNLPK